MKRLSPKATIACAIVLFAAILITLGLVGARVSRRAAEDRLRTAVEDIVVELDDCVSRQLAFIGRTICERFGSPEAMTNLDFSALMKSYGLDELNAIDGRGFIVASSLPIVGDDQWKKANPAKFNQALLKDGAGIYTQCFRPSADEPNLYYKYVGVAFPPPAKGYLQLGFSRSRLQDSIDYSLRTVAESWHIGESGFYVVSKTVTGEILSCGRESFKGQTYADAGFDIFLAQSMPNVERRDPVSNDFLGFDKVRFFIATFNGERCLCTTGVVNQFHRYVAMIPFSEIFGSSRRLVAASAIVMFFVFVLAGSFLSRLSKKNRELEVFIVRDREQREKDLAVAKTIQTSSLPAVFPDEPNWKIYARMITAREVGGDFYDFFTLSDGRVFFLIADVSGKGIPAAMFMMKAKAIMRASILTCDDLAAGVSAANGRLAENNDANMFVTAWIGLFDPKTGVVEYVNAGHNPPLIKRADGSVEWVRGRCGLVLAAMDSIRYRSERLVLSPGDSLCLYTDGVTEATNGALELYGEASLEATLRSASPSYVEAILRDVAGFANGTEQADDITLLVLDYKTA